MSIPSTDFPALFVCHQLGLCVPISGVKMSWKNQVFSFVNFKLGTFCTVSGTLYPSQPASGGWGPELRTCTPFAKKMGSSAQLHLWAMIFWYFRWLYPGSPCAHSPLVKPGSHCHGPYQATEDDRSIEDLEKMRVIIFLDNLTLLNLSGRDPSEVDGSIASFGWQVLFVWSRRGHHTTRCKIIWSQWYNDKLMDRKLPIISASSQSTDENTSRKLGPGFNALRPMLNV